MDQVNTGTPKYPVLRLANPTDEFPNNNENHRCDNEPQTKFTGTTNYVPRIKTFSTSTPTRSANVTNLTGTITSSHPLMNDDSPMSPISTEADKFASKYSPKRGGGKKKGTKYAFKSEPEELVVKLDQSVQEGDNTIQKRKLLKAISLSSSEDEDLSVYEAVANPDLQNVSLTIGETKSEPIPAIRRRRRISIGELRDIIDSDDDESSVEDSQLSEFILNQLDQSESTGSKLEDTEAIEEYSAGDELNELRFWKKIILPNGEHRSIDMKVIEPYKRIFSHGGYLKAGGHNAIVVFSACFLPDKSRLDYDYVMDNLFLYVLTTLNQLVTEDYVLVYLHGGTNKSARPSFSWINKCYHLVDRKLKKNLKKLYIVHPTIWIRTLLIICKPFISSKFYKKVHYTNSLRELSEHLPIAQASIPEKVKAYDQHLNS